MHPGLPRTVVYSSSYPSSANSPRSGDCTGYEDLSRHFNVFLVSDATLATFPLSTQPTLTFRSQRSTS